MPRPTLAAAARWAPHSPARVPKAAAGNPRCPCLGDALRRAQTLADAYKTRRGHRPNPSHGFFSRSTASAVKNRGRRSRKGEEGRVKGRGKNSGPWSATAAGTRHSRAKEEGGRDHRPPRRSRSAAPPEDADTELAPRSTTSASPLCTAPTHLCFTSTRPRLLLYRPCR